MPLTQIKTSNLDSTNSVNFRNRIINGDMRIDQRNGGTSVNITSSPGTYINDRFKAENSTDGTLTGQRSTTAPAGFINSILLTVGTADTSLTSTQYCILEQRIEGLNISDLAWGTADARPITVSFRVRSSVTGTYGASIVNNDFNRTYPFSYTINSVNTWETKTVTIPGDTTGTWLTSNSVGLILRFGFGVGTAYSATSGVWASGGFLSATNTVNFMATAGATFYITGIQLEVGTAATAFEYRPFGTELQLCQRYCQKLMPGIQLCKMRELDRSRQGHYTFPVQMRTTATVGAMATTDGISATISSQSDRGFSAYLTVPGDGYGAQIDTQALATAEL